MIRPKIPHLKGHIYIGSTIRTMEERYKEHTNAYNKWFTSYTSKRTSAIKIFAMYGYDNCECILLETIEDKTELRKKEMYYIQKQKCVNIHKRLCLEKSIKYITIQDIWEQNSTFKPYSSLK